MTDVVRDAPRAPLPPVDPAVRIPDAVKAASAAADQFYQAPPEPTPPAPPAPPEPTPPAPPAPPEPTPPAPNGAADDANWERRYNAMKGRFEVATRTITEMQTTIEQLGEELQARDRSLQGFQNGTNQPKPGAPNAPQITEEDEQTYGRELIDMTRRAAIDAVRPQIDQLAQENQQLKQRLSQTGRVSMVQVLDQQVPNWRQINSSPEWKNWLALRDVYSGRGRKELLEAAKRAADAPRVVGFFRGFLAEHPQGNEHLPLPAAPAPTPPRPAALSLESLAAPGRPSPAPGLTEVPGAKPTYTHAQIKQFYSDVRAGVYRGRDAEKVQLEQDIFAAQREGRVR